MLLYLMITLSQDTVRLSPGICDHVISDNATVIIANPISYVKYLFVFSGIFRRIFLLPGRYNLLLRHTAQK